MALVDLVGVDDSVQAWFLKTVFQWSHLTCCLLVPIKDCDSFSGPAPVPVPASAQVPPQPRPLASAPALSAPTPSNRPPWVCDPNFADKYDPGKTPTSTMKVPPLPQAAPPPPKYIPNLSPAAPSPSPIAPNPAPFSPVARGVAQRAERFAASSRTPLCGACNSIIR